MSFYFNDESLFSNINNVINYINNPDNKIKKVTFITTSNRWEGDKINTPKSTAIAQLIKKYVDCDVDLIDVPSLKIHPCEGNVSSYKGNICGVKDALMKDKEKNPNNIHRCWASVNNKDDELYKVVNSVMESELVMFFTSVRWGQTNSIYQKLIERLTWLENRHTTLGESNLIKNKEAGIIAIGQNWNGEEAVKLEKEVLEFFGFKTPDVLSFNWQYLKDPNDESKKSYKSAYPDFLKEFNFVESLKESIMKFRNWIKI